MNKFFSLIEKFILSTSFGHYSLKKLILELFLFPLNLMSKSGRSSSLLSVDLFVTSKCNIRCAMCNAVPLLNSNARLNDPTTETLSSWISQLSKFKPYICLMGGEPILRDDIVEIIRQIKRSGMKCGLYTNGISVEPYRYLEVCNAGLDDIIFSIHGPGKEHSLITGKKSDVLCILKMIKELQANTKTKVSVYCCLLQENIQTIYEFVELLKDYTIKNIRFAHTSFRTDAEISKDNPKPEVKFPLYKTMPLDPALGSKVSNFVSSMKRVHGIKTYFSPPLSSRQVRSWYGENFPIKNRGCTIFSHRGCCIYPSGDVTTCEQLGIVVGNLYNQSFELIYNSKAYCNFRNEIKKKIRVECHRCCQL